MVSRRLRRLDARGYTLAEIAVVVAVVGIMMTLSIPPFLSYWQTSTLRAGAEELATLLNTARQLAIKENTSVCVQFSGSGVKYYLNAACTGAAWTGPGTDATGLIRLSNNVRVSASTASVVFSYLGAATTGGTYTVTNPTNNQTLSVAVASSGRISIGP